MTTFLAFFSTLKAYAFLPCSDLNVKLIVSTFSTFIELCTHHQCCFWRALGSRVACSRLLEYRPVSINAHGRPLLLDSPWPLPVWTKWIRICMPAILLGMKTIMDILVTHMRCLCSTWRDIPGKVHSVSNERVFPGLNFTVTGWFPLTGMPQVIRGSLLNWLMVQGRFKAQFPSFANGSAQKLFIKRIKTRSFLFLLSLPTQEHLLS